MKLTDAELELVARLVAEGRPVPAPVVSALLDEVREVRRRPATGTDPATWTNERCPAHGRFRCGTCLGVPEVPGARGGKGSLASVVLAGRVMRRARGAAFCRCGAVEFIVPAALRVRVRGREHTPASCDSEVK